MTSLVPSVYDEREYVHVTGWTIDSAEHLSRLRADLTARLRAMGAGYPEGLNGVAQKMELVASELATNALVHGLPPITLDLRASDDEFLIDVVDHAPDTVPEVDGGRPAGHGGLGLQIATRIAVDVGWFTGPDAKHVWASFPRG